MTARRIAVVAVLALLAGCGGDDDDGAASSTTTTTGAHEETTSTTGSASAPEASPTSAPEGSGATEGPATTTGRPSESSVGARPGQYRYIVEGTASGGTPPTTQRHRHTSTLTVSPPNGNDQRFELRSPEGQGTDTVMRYGGGAVHLVQLTLHGQLEKEFRPDSPVLAIKADPSPGDRWSWDMRSTDGSTTMHNDSEVIGREKVTVGGRTVDTLRVHHDIRMTTTFNGAPVTVDIATTVWHELDLALTVKDHTVVDVPGFIHDDSTSTLESLDPS